MRSKEKVKGMNERWEKKRAPIGVRDSLAVGVALVSPTRPRQADYKYEASRARQSVLIRTSLRNWLLSSAFSTLISLKKILNYIFTIFHKILSFCISTNGKNCNTYLLLVKIVIIFTSWNNPLIWTTVLNEKFSFL